MSEIAVDVEAELSAVMDQWCRIDAATGHQWVGEMRVDKATSKIPMMTAEELWRLRTSIREEGQRYPGKVRMASDGQMEIVTGRSRALACLAEGMDFDYEYIEDDESETVVRIDDLVRRHLEKSQLAFLLAEINPELPALELSRAAPVSESLVTKAKKVAREATEKVKQAVRDGEIVLTTAEKTLRLEPEVADKAVEEVISGAKPEKEIVPAAEKVKTPVVFERWRESVESTISKVIAKLDEDQQDRGKLAIGEMLSVRIRRAKSEDEQDFAFLENNGETLLMIIGEKLEGMTVRERKAARKLLTETYTEQPEATVETPKTADDVIDKLNEMVGALTAKEAAKAQKQLQSLFPAEVGGKPKEYLPELPKEHAAAAEMVKKEISERVTQLGKIADWNGSTEALRGLAKHFGVKGKQVLRDAGVTAKEETPVLVESTWPEHLDTEKVKGLWDKYIAARTKAKMTIEPDRLELIVGELSQFEHDAVCELLVKGRQGAKGKPWGAFDHADLQSKYGIKRGRDGKLLSESDRVGQKATVEDWNTLRAAMIEFNAEWDGAKIRQAVGNAMIFDVASKIGLVKIERAKGHELNDLKEIFLVKLTEARNKS